MDLSFHRFATGCQPVSLPPELAVMMVGISARQAASPTALFHTRLFCGGVAEHWFAPSSGAFNAAVAETLRRWQQV